MKGTRKHLTVIDPVCGMKIERRRCRFSETDGKHTYYFCSIACMAEFERHPKEYKEGRTNPHLGGSECAGSWVI